MSETLAPYAIESVNLAQSAQIVGEETMIVMGDKYQKIYVQIAGKKIGIKVSTPSSCYNPPHVFHKGKGEYTRAIFNIKFPHEGETEKLLMTEINLPLAKLMYKRDYEWNKGNDTMLSFKEFIETHWEDVVKCSVVSEPEQTVRKDGTESKYKVGDFFPSELPLNFLLANQKGKPMQIAPTISIFAPDGNLIKDPTEIKNCPIQSFIFEITHVQWDGTKYKVKLDCKVVKCGQSVQVTYDPDAVQPAPIFKATAAVAADAKARKGAKRKAESAPSTDDTTEDSKSSSSADSSSKPTPPKRAKAASVKELQSMSASSKTKAKVAAAVAASRHDSDDDTNDVDLT